MVSPKCKSLIGSTEDFTDQTVTEIEKDAVIHYKTAVIEMKAASRTVGEWNISDSWRSGVFISKS